MNKNTFVKNNNIWTWSIRVSNQEKLLIYNKKKLLNNTLQFFILYLWIEKNFINIDIQQQKQKKQSEIIIFIEQISINKYTKFYINISEFCKLIQPDQKTDSYHPVNCVIHILEVDIMSTLDNFTVQDIIEKIQKLIKLKYLRINEFIRDYDFLHNGSITIFIILFHC